MNLKMVSTIVFTICLSSVICQQSSAQNMPSGMKIWFTHPADNWNEALPVGNGRLGAMIFGGVENEHIELNESSVWTGEPRWDANPDALKTLPVVRQLLFQRKFKEAEELAQRKILGMKPQNPAATYQALGDIYIDFGPQRNLSNYVEPIVDITSFSNAFSSRLVESAVRSSLFSFPSCSTLSDCVFSSVLELPWATLCECEEDMSTS